MIDDSLEALEAARNSKVVRPKKALRPYSAIQLTGRESGRDGRENINHKSVQKIATRKGVPPEQNYLIHDQPEHQKVGVMQVYGKLLHDTKSKAKLHETNVALTLHNPQHRPQNGLQQEPQKEPQHELFTNDSLRQSLQSLGQSKELSLAELEAEFSDDLLSIPSALNPNFPDYVHGIRPYSSPVVRFTPSIPLSSSVSHNKDGEIIRSNIMGGMLSQKERDFVQLDGQLDRQLERQLERQAEKQKERQPERQIDFSLSERLSERQLERQLERQTEKQLERRTEKAHSRPVSPSIYTPLEERISHRLEREFLSIPHPRFRLPSPTRRTEKLEQRLGISEQG
jgi:hypothetical protein